MSSTGGREFIPRRTNSISRNGGRHSGQPTNGSWVMKPLLLVILGAPTHEQANIDFPKWKVSSESTCGKQGLSELEFDETELNQRPRRIDSGWITAGPKTQAFEEAFARLSGTTEACRLQ